VIVDCDTHISPGGGEFSLERHLEDMEKAGVHRTLCWLSPHHYTDPNGLERGNRYVYGAVKKHPDKIIGFGWADPTFGLARARDQATRCVEEFGFCGVKMNGAQNNFTIDDPKVGLPLAEHIAGLGVMLAFHIGPDAYERTHPQRAARIARRIPDTPVLMVHMGMTNNDMNGAVIEAAAECANMVLVGSATTYKAVLRAVRELGAERVLFGSDRPFTKMAVMRAVYETGLEGEISRQELALIMGGNAEKLFRR